MKCKPSAEIWNRAKIEALILLFYFLGHGWQGQTSHAQLSENENSTVYNNFWWHV